MNAKPRTKMTYPEMGAVCVGAASDMHRPCCVAQQKLLNDVLGAAGVFVAPASQSRE